VRARALLIVTAIVSSILGATVVWLVLTVPNDLEAGALMQQAKKDIDARQNDRARDKLTRIVQQYPRTDAAAAATVALIKLADADRTQLATAVVTLERELAKQKKDLGAVSQKVAEAAKAPPPPAPKPEVKPAPKPVPKKKAPAHKSRHKPHHR
jgi:predicted negative regulator of RcsB-dependent stress response